MNITKTIRLIFLLVLSTGFLISCNQQVSKTENKSDENSIEEVLAGAKPAQDTTLEAYRRQGKEIVKETFSALNAQLKAALQRDGVPHALKFCNLAAIPITDSLASLYDVDIKRVSLQNRNPDNAPDALEESLISTLEKLMVASFNMVVLDQDENPVYIQPILLADQCLQCHGQPGKDITTENYEIIKSLYPDDLATGYSSGDLRGIWRIRFNKKVLN